ncbi:hypothetical protein EJ08DRAFT_477336 [Tothia fuscella]|uniref:Uncharacterized protein n=1 Tax=Tothia fuscella TaxID=1048955 RepID=A0A9P4TUF4_9PEZI|nr:hypothetical protein EJ08DRAFT_477336 [Tothia fuscella]
MQYYTAIAIEDVLNIKGLDPNGRSQVPCPKYILIPVIISDSPTKPIIERILSETGKSIEVLENEEYPGVQYDVRTDEKAKAIVASPHGQAVAWFLIQHKDQFGVHEMKTVKMYYELSHWNLWFELGPVEHGAKKRDVPSLHHMNQKRRVDLEGELRPMLAEVV